MTLPKANQRQYPQLIASFAVAALFAYALFSKLKDPEQLLAPLGSGLGFSNTAAAIFFVITILALSICIAILLFKKGKMGLLLSATFFLSGAIYAIALDTNKYQGDCGCSITTTAKSENQLIIHAYQNTASAVFCIFLGFRTNPKGNSNESIVS